MGALTWDALFRSLKKGAPDPVYYLHGDEDVLKDEAVRALVDRAVDPGARDFNVDSRAAADLDPEALHALVNTPPMLAATRAVIIRSVEHLKKTKVHDELLRYLANPNPTTLLILVQGSGEEKPDAELTARATAVAVERLPPERVARWVAHRATERKVALEPEAMELLVAAVGNDLAALAQELDKLAGLAGGGAGGAGMVTAADVAALVGVRHGETVFDLVDAAMERRAAAAARLVEPVLEQAGMTGVRIATALGTALIGTALARSELDRGVPRARLPDVLFRHLLAARPFGLRNWREEAARWTRWAGDGSWEPAELRRALRLTLAADQALKGTTVSDDRGIVLQLVLAWAVPAREAA